MALPLPSSSRFLLVMGVDTDGSIEIDSATYGDDEEARQLLVDTVDRYTDRDLDGMALEAFLIVAKPGQVYAVMQNERPVAVVVCLSPEPWRAEQAPLPAPPYLGSTRVPSAAWTIVDRALASDNAIAHIRAHNATVMPSEERYGTATIYVYTDGSGIAVQGNGYAVVKRIDEDWYTVDRDDNMTDEDIDALNVRTAAFMWVVDCATEAHVEALQAAVSRLENDVVLVDDDGEKTRPLVGVRLASPGAEIGLYWEQRPGHFLRFGDAVTPPRELTELLLNAERAVGA